MDVPVAFSAGAGYTSNTGSTTLYANELPGEVLIPFSSQFHFSEPGAFPGYSLTTVCPKCMILKNIQKEKKAIFLRIIFLNLK
jgi:hypothetical protein